LLDLAATRGMAALADAWLPPMVHPARRNDAFLAPLKAMVRSVTPEVYAGQIRALLGRLDATPLLPTFKLPVYAVVGRQDEWSTLAEHEAFAKLIPGAKLVVIEDSGHFTPLEQPDALTNALRDFMHEPV
jgi:pimeloyl-ACP methyl ester carboxylesterase